MWTWPEIVEQLYKETGHTIYEGIQLRDEFDNRLLNDMISHL
jgi:hypothetical protein